jgi:hypothetical protein
LDTVAFHTIVVFVIPLVTFTNVNIHDVAWRTPFHSLYYERYAFCIHPSRLNW